MRRTGLFPASIRRLQIFGEHLKPNTVSQHARIVHQAASNSSISLSVSAKHVLIDEKVQIIVRGLRPGQNVTLQAYMEESDRQYGSCGHFVADKSGVLDTYKHASKGGTFTGVEPMGLFWSMRTKPGQQVRRLVKADVMTPFDVTLALYDGIKQFEELPWDNIKSACVASCLLLRSYTAPGVRRVPVEQNGIYGTFFFPPGDGPFPTVIDLFGLTSEIIEFRSALFASHGIASFVITYIGYKDLPKRHEDFDFNYFLKAFDFMTAHPLVDRGAIGGVATCGGVSFLQLIAAKRPLIKCYVSINGALTFVGPTQTVEGEVMVGSTFKMNKAKIINGNLIMKDMYTKEDGNIAFPGWRNGARVLFIQGLDDQCVHPEMLRQVQSGVSKEELEQMTFRYYEGAGHLIEPPFTPHSRANYNPFLKFNLLWGGEPQLHAKAQEDSWKEILAFLHKYL